MSCPCPRDQSPASPAEPSPTQAGRPGTLILVVGPSGAGKDTLMRRAQTALADCPRFVFVRRVITRPADPDTEDFDSAAPGDFAAARAAGAFALHWSAHGLDYGLPRDALACLAEGRHAIANGSRAILETARARFAALHILHVTAPVPVLAQRLAARGRESRDAIAERLSRAASHPVEGADISTVLNDGSPEAGTARFLTALARLEPSCRVLAALTDARSGL